ncbi:MAG TPA: YggS family pyridoxal phosphate-dependent enzyme [Vicinamibacteria bacterium]|nr:YggS family pyridoxal phosphate-dependent enzyme [Vicinamibacteria bacterium]
MEIPSRVAAIRERMESACRRAGRSPSDVRLVAVTKTRTADEVAAVVAAGVEDLGENRVQEAETKYPAIAALEKGARFHLVGHLQKNKVKKAVALFDWIHSLDSVELGQKIGSSAGELGKVQPVLVQVDLASEPTKFGLPEVELLPTLESLTGLSGLRIDGLMALPPFEADPESVRPYFRRLRELGTEAAGRGLAGRELSMGMSHDFEVAIEEGATFVRIGTALFGPRVAGNRTAENEQQTAGPGGPHPPRAKSEGSEPSEELGEH